MNTYISPYLSSVSFPAFYDIYLDIGHKSFCNDVWLFHYHNILCSSDKLSQMLYLHKVLPFSSLSWTKTCSYHSFQTYPDKRGLLSGNVLLWSQFFALEETLTNDYIPCSIGFFCYVFAPKSGWSLHPLVKVFFSIKHTAKEKLLKFQLAINNLAYIWIIYCKTI